MTAPSELRGVVARAIGEELRRQELAGECDIDGHESDLKIADVVLALPALSGCGAARNEKQIERIATAIVDLAIERPEDARRSVKAILVLSLLPGLSGGISSSSVDESGGTRVARTDTQNSAGGGEYFTLVFEGNLRNFKQNPFHTDTPFGRPIRSGLGDAFAEIDALTEAAEARDA